MSLEDRYNRGGGRLDNLDRYLTHLGDRVGNAWLDRTGAPRAVLTQGLYLFAVWAGLQYLLLAREPLFFVIVGQALLSLLGIGLSRGGLVEQIQVEALGLPRSTFAFLRIVLLGTGLLSLAEAAGSLAVALQSGSPLPFDATTSLLQGCALVALQAGEYIRRTNPPTISNGRGLGI